MDRTNLEKHTFDVLIIGGGIVGSGIFRDLSLHDKSTLVLDQADFNSQTSAGSSKMLHGGIRYLENLDFTLVFEALYEKNHWIKTTPHLAKEVPFYLPVYRHSKWPLLFLKIGLFIYDLLSLFKNTPHKTFSKKATLRKLPGLDEQGLKGCGMYFDAVVDDHKLGLECIYDGLLNDQCLAKNYHKVTSVTKKENTYLVKALDLLTKKEFFFSAKNIVIATGPFIDQTMKQLDLDWEPVIMPSKGSHLWLDKNSIPNFTNSMVLQTKDNRIIFVIPQRNSILVGTTEVPLKPDEDFADLKASEEEIEYLLSEVNTYFPNANVTKEDILSTYAAVRPLVKDGGKNSSKISRKHKTYHIEDHLFAITGGKYTTFRKMAQDLNSELFAQNGWSYNKSLSLSPLKAVSIISDPHLKTIEKHELKKIQEKELIRTKSDLIERRLSLPNLNHLSNKISRKAIEDFNL